MEYVLETKALCKRYRNFTALSGLNMRIPEGAIYGFAGRNGAGKTTLVRLICGLQEPTDGSYTLYGTENTQPQIIRSRRRMGAVVESPAIYPDMTARENLRQQYRVLGLPSDDGIDSTHYTDFYRRYADEDGESTAEDVAVDDTSNSEKLFFNQWQTDALFDAYENLDYRERMMVADHLGFCPECYGIYEPGSDKNGNPVKLLRKGKAYIDLAAEHTLSSPDTAFRTVNGAYEKMRRELTEKGIY